MFSTVLCLLKKVMLLSVRGLISDIAGRILLPDFRGGTVYVALYDKHSKTEGFFGLWSFLICHPFFLQSVLSLRFLIQWGAGDK